jgi:hypothetical protein
MSDIVMGTFSNKQSLFFCNEFMPSEINTEMRIRTVSLKETKNKISKV